MSEREFFCRVWDMGDHEPGREIVDTVESTLFMDDIGRPIRFTHVYAFQGEWTWRAFIFGRWSHFGWQDVVRRFGPVRAVRSQELKP